MSKSNVVTECVGRMDSYEGDEQPLEQEASVNASRLSSVEALTPQDFQAYHEFADRPMPPLPKDFLRAVK